ncbi:unnamed protein product, partial [Mesorhabditis spiculigera]
MSNFEDLCDDLHENIQGVNRYNPENVGQLERCVKAMISENRYDRDISLTLLKLYQLNPDRYEETSVKSILLKTLMELPAPDFALAKSLLDANRINSAEIKRVLDLGAVLESCNFGVFWKLMKGEYRPTTEPSEPFRQPAEVAKLVKAIPGFDEAVRVFVCKAVSVTYQNIEKSILARLLGGVTEAQLKEYATTFNWKIHDGVISIANHEATIRSRNIDEKLQFSDVTEILKQIVDYFLLQNSSLGTAAKSSRVKVVLPRAGMARRRQDARADDEQPAGLGIEPKRSDPPRFFDIPREDAFPLLGRNLLVMRGHLLWMQCFFKWFCFPTDAFKGVPYPEEDFTILDKTLLWFFDGFKRWDALHFFAYC